MVAPAARKRCRLPLRMKRLACLSWLLATSLLLAAPSQARPALRVPTRADAVLEFLPHGYSRLAGGERSIPPTTAQVGALLDAAARSGDARLATRAEALLPRLPTSTDPQALRLLRAFAAQHRHDFRGALLQLDAALADDSRNAVARLTRAQVQLVQGRLDLARRDCIALVLNIDSGAGLTCLTALSLRRGDADSAARLADQWLAQTDATDPMRGYMLVLRAEAAGCRQGAADAWFEKALALSPRDVRALAAYARCLRAAGRNRETVALLGPRPASDGLAFQRTLAAWDLHLPGSAGDLRALGRRFDQARRVGAPVELRDEAEFLLATRQAPERALQLALRNFEQQRDREDVDVLLRSARAADRPAALAGLRDWARSQQLAVP